MNQKFTGQERDAETGLDFFQARYFSAALGRFNSPDPGNAGASLFTPQSWNGYTYVYNNPLTLIDPSGTSPSIGSNPRQTTRAPTIHSSAVDRDFPIPTFLSRGLGAAAATTTAADPATYAHRDSAYGRGLRTGADRIVRQYLASDCGRCWRRSHCP